MRVHRAQSLAGLSLRDIEYAVAVAELRHFGKAADRCAVSQSALSEQVRKLEARLGTALFERSPRGVAPTPRGAALLQQAGRVLAEARGLLEMAASLAEPATGPLYLGVIATLGPYYMPHLLRPVRLRFPNLALRVTEGRTVELLEGLRRGVLDAVLLALPAAAEGLRSEALFFEPFHLVCPAGHRLETLRRLRVSDLEGDDLILLEEGHCLRDQAIQLCAGARTGLDVRQATSIEMLWHMIAAGEGYSLLPLLAVQGRRAMTEIVSFRDLDGPAAGRTIGMVWRGTDPRGPEFQQLCEFLRGHLPPGLAAATSRPPSAPPPPPPS